MFFIIINLFNEQDIPKFSVNVLNFLDKVRSILVSENRNPKHRLIQFPHVNGNQTWKWKIFRSVSIAYKFVSLEIDLKEERKKFSKNFEFSFCAIIFDLRTFFFIIKLVLREKGEKT